MEQYFLMYILGPEKIYKAMIEMMLDAILCRFQSKPMIQAIFNAFNLRTKKGSPNSLLVHGIGEDN
jgi:hypothetical protein